MAPCTGFSEDDTCQNMVLSEALKMLEDSIPSDQWVTLQVRALSKGFGHWRSSSGFEGRTLRRVFTHGRTKHYEDVGGPSSV